MNAVLSWEGPVPHTGPFPGLVTMTRLTSPSRPETFGTELVLSTAIHWDHENDPHSFRFGFGGLGDDLLAVDFPIRTYDNPIGGATVNERVLRASRLFLRLVQTCMWSSTHVVLSTVEDHVRGCVDLAYSEP